MPLFKQVTAQQKRSKRKAEALLSDEEGNDSSSEEELELSSDEEEGSGSGEDESEDGDEVDDSVGSAGEGDSDDEEQDLVLDEDQPRPPPAGFPTAKEALENTVASTAALIAEMDAEKGEEAKGGAEDDEEEEEAPLVCVVCPNKILKPGKMVEVHLASKVSTALSEFRFSFPKKLICRVRNRTTTVDSTDLKCTSSHPTS